MIEISKKTARKINLFAQGFAQSKRFGTGKSGALKVIQDLGYLQIDTISVVSRAHHHTLWARVPKYQNDYLFDLLNRDRKIFEYWAHAASFLPIESYRFSLFRKRGLKSGETHWWPDDPKTEAYVMDRIRAEGPLRSKDFEHTQKSNGWFDWKPAKKALDKLYMQGSLMIAAREKFQKVYDLTERVLPEGTDTRLPSQAEYAKHLIDLHLKAQGLIREKEVGHLRKGKKKLINQAIKDQVEEGNLLEVKVKGVDGKPWYTRTEYLELAEKRSGNRRLHLLCPFDNLIIQRERPSDLFDFDYKLECYVPAPKRLVGYYSLPVLYGDQFVAQVDAKADRKSKELIIKNFVIESEKDQIIWQEKLEQKLLEYARFNACETVVW